MKQLLMDTWALWGLFGSFCFIKVFYYLILLKLDSLAPNLRGEGYWRLESRVFYLISLSFLDTLNTPC